MSPTLHNLEVLALFALLEKIGFGVCKKFKNFVITNLFVTLIANETREIFRATKKDRQLK